MRKNEVILIGYSGHAFVLCDIFLSKGILPIAYFEKEEKSKNPYKIEYLGTEVNEIAKEILLNSQYFVAIGDNQIRADITKNQALTTKNLVNAIHNNSSISPTVILGNGIMVNDGAVICACVKIGDGVICNTQSVIDHECSIGEFSHIGPGAVLCANVNIGRQTFIGARSVVKQGVTIGNNVIVGAGAVVIKDIPSNSKVVGNPQKFI